MNKLDEIKQLYTRFDGPNPPSEDLFQWMIARMEKLEDVAKAAKEFKPVYDKIKDRGLIGQRDLYKWYQDENDLFYPLFRALEALESTGEK